MRGGVGVCRYREGEWKGEGREEWNRWRGRRVTKEREGNAGMKRTRSRDTERHRHTDRQTDKETERQTVLQTDGLAFRSRKTRRRGYVFLVRYAPYIEKRVLLA